jgi:hypothetical protein
LRLVDGVDHCEASWMGFRFLDLQVSERHEPQTEPPGPQLEGTLMLKYVPRTGAWGQADICQVSFTPGETPSLTVESRKPANGTVKFHRATWQDLPTMYHVVNALADLPVLQWCAGRRHPWSEGARLASGRGTREATTWPRIGCGWPRVESQSKGSPRRYF